MKRKLLLLVFCLFALSVFADQSSLSLRRFALFIGSNNGGRERVTLRYAETDALAMASLMQEVGGIAPEDSLVLLAPTQADLTGGLSKMQRRIQQAKQKARRVEFLLYYSGHSDELGLLLGEDSMAYRELKNAMIGMDADVNIAILDSCSSGAFTRLKGGTRQPPFLLDDSVQMKGHAFLTSSSADEAAQESDRISASFFTYYLISGLRGAADVTRDGQVTLNEVYHYAFTETLARTENTRGGAQHPSYNIQLTGTGDLTLTDLRSNTAGVVIGEEIQGRLYIRDSRGNLMVELQKLPDIPVALVLPAGQYEITLDRDGSLYETSVVLKNGRREKITLNKFSHKLREETIFRGSPSVGGNNTEETVLVPFNVSLLPLSAVKEARIVHNFSLNLLIGYSYAIHGCEIGAILNMVSKEIVGAQFAGVGNILGGNITGTQQAGVFNLVEGDSSGFQAAGVFNIVEGSASFFQAAGVFNILGGNITGTQQAGVFNLVQGDCSGFQAAGVFNITEGGLKGVQAAGIFNKAEIVSGAQVGLVNIASGVTGAQIGLVNIAGEEVKGTQIGLINISKDLYGVPIGLINVTKKGCHFSTWLTDDRLAYLGFQTGNRYLYTIIYGGIEVKESPSLFTTGIGMGFHIPMGPFFIDADISAKQVFKGFSTEAIIQAFSYNDAISVFPSVRAIAGINIFKRFSLFGGVLMETHIPGITRESALHTGSPFNVNIWDFELSFYPKLFVGLQI